MPRRAGRCIEPFVGSGAVTLNFGRPRNLLADTNRDLMSVYEMLKEHGEDFIEHCSTLFVPENNARDAFYALRAEFNRSTEARRKAALFVFLNRHGYNGLCRYNSRGELNVPFGRYANPRFPRERMQVFGTFLQDCELRHADFRDVIAESGSDDFVYCDPPYIPASETANFTAYAPNGFTARDHHDLAACCQAAAERGACVVISNHDTPLTRDLYRDADECIELSVARRISCHSDTRSPARELLVVFRPRVPALNPPAAA